MEWKGEKNKRMAVMRTLMTFPIPTLNLSGGVFFGFSIFESKTLPSGKVPAIT
jgi:hypothetical protein